MEINTIVRNQEDVNEMVKYSLDLITKGGIEESYKIPPMENVQISNLLKNFNGHSMVEIAEMIGKGFVLIKDNYSDEVIEKYKKTLRRSFKSACKCAMRVPSISRHRSTFVDSVFINRDLITESDVSTIVEGYPGKIGDLKDFVNENPTYAGLIKNPYGCVVRTVNTFYKQNGVYNLYIVQFLGEGHNFIVDFSRYNKILSRVCTVMDNYGIHL